jgi:hypothetical protein
MAGAGQMTAGVTKQVAADSREASVAGADDRAPWGLHGGGKYEEFESIDEYGASQWRDDARKFVPTPVEDGPDEEMERLMSSIFYPMHRMIRAVLPQMVGRRAGKLSWLAESVVVA